MGEMHATKQTVIKVSRKRLKTFNLSGMEREMSGEWDRRSVWCIRCSP